MPIAHYGSIVPDLVDSLRGELCSGAWSERLPGEHELCERFHVSRPTLRKALLLLKQEGLIDSKPGMGWRIVKSGQAGRSRFRAKSVGVLCFISLDEASPFTLLQLDKLQEHLNQAGLKVHVHAGAQYHSQNFRQALERLVSGSPPSVWVLVSSNERVQRWFQERKIPFFDAGTASRTSRFPGLYYDVGGVYHQALELLARRGHHGVTFVLPQDGNYFLPAEEKLRAEQQPGEVVELALDTPAGKWSVTRRIVLHPGTPEGVCKALSMQIKLRQPPTAFVVARPKHTLTALTFLLRSGFRIPQDVSLMSIGHQSYLDLVTPTIAHFAIDQNAYVRKLCRMVVPWAKTGFWSLKETAVGMKFHDGESLAPTASPAGEQPSPPASNR